MKSRKTWFWCILLLIALILGAAVVYMAARAISNTAVLVQAPPEIISTDDHPGNNRQRKATVWLGCYDNQLYYYGDRRSSILKTKYYGSLCVFRGNELAEIFPLSRGKGTIMIWGLVDNYLYYLDTPRDDFKRQKLYCYDLESNEEVLLYTGHIYASNSQYFDQDGSVYFPLFPENGKTAQFVHVSGRTVLGIEPLTGGYALGGSMYYVVQEYSDAQVARVLKADPDDPAQFDEIPLDGAYRRWILPYDGGLLVHNERQNSLLYQIHEDGSITNLFSIPCMASESAVNVHGTDVYLSVLRYEKYGELGMLRYENDTMEGTYRISLIDGSAEKINDMCFDGIFNFDDTCFYCSDKQGNVYKMEFDGIVSPVLLIEQD